MVILPFGQFSGQHTKWHHERQMQEDRWLVVHVKEQA